MSTDANAKVVDWSRRSRNQNLLPTSTRLFQFFGKFQVKEGDSIHSTARIRLPFMVKPDFDRIILGWEGTKQIVLFLTLTAITRNYKKDEDVLVVQTIRGPVRQKQATDQAFSSISNF